MGSEISSFPDIIRAVTDFYGLLALCVLVIGGLAYKMNADAAPNVRAIIFLAILASFVLLVYLAFNRGGEVAPPGGGGEKSAPVENGGERPAPADPDEPPLADPEEPPLADPEEPPLARETVGLIFPDSDRRLLTDSEVRALPRAERRLARNEIYARRGRLFKDAGLRRHFERFAWYAPTTFDVELNAVEARNVARIERIERE